MNDEVKRISQAIKSRDEAEVLLRRIGDSMVRLVQIFEKETKLVEAGQIASATKLTQEKTDLAAVYLREIEILKSNAGFIGQTVPVLVDELRRAHQTFRESNLPRDSEPQPSCRRDGPVGRRRHHAWRCRRSGAQILAAGLWRERQGC